MCNGCLAIAGLVHDDSYVPDPNLMQKATQTFKDLKLRDHDLGVLFIVMGKEMLEWE
jgi:hypothetical protein